MTSPVIMPLSFLFACLFPPRAPRPSHLEREDEIAVHILVQAIVVAFAVLQEQRRRPHLAPISVTKSSRCIRPSESYGADKHLLSR